MPLALQAYSLDWALAQALLSSDTNVFSRCFEFKALHHDWIEVRKWLRGSDILDWHVSSTRSTLAPKHALGFRKVTQLDPVDYVIFTSLVREVGKQLEKSRIPAADNIVFSNRFDPHSSGRIYSDRYTYMDFQIESRRICTEEDYPYVVMTDIADFFPRLYHHRIENTLEAILGEGHQHVVALLKILKQLSSGNSYGIPVGPRVCFLLAEVTIGDIDHCLLSERTRFVRYVDDYRLFCRSETDAYRRLHYLASVLDSNHGLTLQQTKTRIVDRDTFLARFAYDPSETEQGRLNERIESILEIAGLDSIYDVWQGNLTDEQEAELEKLNLSEILSDCLIHAKDDVGLISFVLRRLGDIGDARAAELILNNLEALYAVMRSVVAYFHSIINKMPADEKIQSQVVQLLDCMEMDLKVSAPDYNKMMLATLFRNKNLKYDVNRVLHLYNSIPNDNVRRELILGIGCLGGDFWLRTRKQALGEFQPWTRRALLVALSGLPHDEYKYWASSLEQHCGPLDRAILRWSQVNPLRVLGAV